jgi:hypothetical protein
MLARIGTRADHNPVLLVAAFWVKMVGGAFIPSFFFIHSNPSYPAEN